MQKNEDIVGSMVSPKEINDTVSGISSTNSHSGRKYILTKENTIRPRKMCIFRGLLMKVEDFINWDRT